MVEMPYGQAFFVLHQESIKPSMPEHRPQRQRIEMKNNVHGMRWYNQVDQNRWKIKQVFHRMHRNPRKRPCGNIPVVQRMHPIIQKLDMQ